MYRSRRAAWLAPTIGVLLLAGAVIAGDTKGDNATVFGFGKVLPERGRQVPRTAIPPDGEGLPEGSGTAEGGRVLYFAQCVSCHGPDLEGTSLGMPLIGGRGSLSSDAPLATVESYWPYATSVYSYIRNTMPITAPGSLRDDETYALVAFILAAARIIPEDRVLNRDTLPDVVMPNRDGFIPDPRPDLEL